MAREPVRYFDRYSGQLRAERIYGEKWLRFAYGNPAGRLGVWLLARRAWLSCLYGWRMKKKDTGLRVIPFISKYDIDVDEFEKSAFDFKSFNEFFCRMLKPSARPIAPGERLAVFPADGRHLAFPNVNAADGFYAKGAKFTLAEVFGDDRDRPLANRFDGGAMLISRLCPVDYHHFHFPVGGVPAESRLISGWLYSVHPLALRRNIRYLVENKRMLTLIESPEFGTVAMLEIGATNVGSIHEGFVPGRRVEKGDEKGFFSFGGSCVITLFEPGRIIFDSDIAAQSAQNIETYAKFGDRLGEASA